MKTGLADMGGFHAGRTMCSSLCFLVVYFVQGMCGLILWLKTKGTELLTLWDANEEGLEGGTLRVGSCGLLFLFLDPFHVCVLVRRFGLLTLFALTWLENLSFARPAVNACRNAGMAWAARALQARRQKQTRWLHQDSWASWVIMRMTMTDCKREHFTG